MGRKVPHADRIDALTIGEGDCGADGTIAGVLYLVTVVTSIAALALKAPALSDPAVLMTTGGQVGLLWAVVLEMLLLAACVGTAVVLFPQLRRRDEAAALGFVGARVIEGAFIALGVVAMLSLVNVSRGTITSETSADAPATIGPAGAALVALHDAAFLLGPGLIPAVNALLLGSILYRSRLVPRILPIVGFIGAPLLVASVIATLGGAVDQVSPLAGLAALPIALWEISLGVWLVVRGFRSSDEL